MSGRSRRSTPSSEEAVAARPRIAPERTALVLGGGGLKGFAHIGVLRALDERGIRPALYAGTSIGAFIAAARVKGMSLAEMEQRARSLRKRDLFRLNHMGMVLERMHSPSLYLGGPLHDLCNAVGPRGTFRDIETPLLINTVDLDRGCQVVWGLPGLQDVYVNDAVYASCALPGFFPPGQVGDRLCIDGGTIDNLPVAVASFGMDAIIAVEVGSEDVTPEENIVSQGFAAIYMRAATSMMRALQVHQLLQWSGPPMLLIRPAVWKYHWFGFGNTTELIQAGYDAASKALDEVGDALFSTGGIYPKRLVDVVVDREKCIGCTTCVSKAPKLMAMDATGKAYAKASPVEWARPDGEIIYHCPTRAISVRLVEQARVPLRTSEHDAAD
ncbi:MAG: patatin-like phospholipase family protein [Gemmatimonadota bacterium]|nr:patatin-like phospholipase family protein [Gemmatimonadota bacterium]